MEATCRSYWELQMLQPLANWSLPTLENIEYKCDSAFFTSQVELQRVSLLTFILGGKWSQFLILLQLVLNHSRFSQPASKWVASIHLCIQQVIQFAWRGLCCGSPHVSSLSIFWLSPSCVTASSNTGNVAAQRGMNFKLRVAEECWPQILGGSHYLPGF